MTDDRWRFINAITETKRYALRNDADIEVDYSPQFINKFLSHYPDTIHDAQLMNRFNFLPKQMQFDYLINTVRKMRRYSKRAKKATQDKNADIDLIMDYCNCSRKKAADTISLLKPEDIQLIRSKLEKGGRHPQNKNG